MKFDDIFENRLSQEEVREYLIELYERGETSAEIAGAASAMRDHCIPLPVHYDLKEKIIDNCGTGGDKSNSFNISTTVSLLLAACGSYVAKHGNRSITSKSGSADMLEALGIKLDLGLENNTKMLEDTGFTFLFVNQTEEDTAASIAGLKTAAQASDHASRFDDLEISVTPRGPMTAERVAHFAELGVSRLILLPQPASGANSLVDGMLAFIDATASDLKLG